MSDEAGEIPGGEVISYPVDSNEPLTVEDAARELAAAREKAFNPPAERAEKTATAEQELPVEGNADPETDPGEIEEAEAGDPPIERPKSWSKDEDAEWQSLPRAMQQKIVARELERDTGITRSQQKAAEATKAAEAKAAQAEEARKQYEAKVSLALQALEREQRRDFPDIKTWEDVKNMQQTDPFRYQAWDVHQKELALVNAADQEAKARQTQAKQTEDRDRKAREHALLIEKAPEFADTKKLSAAQTEAAALFREKGFTDQELEGLGDNPFIDDHRFQLIVADALKYHAIQKAKPTAVPKTLPAVQRPGVRQPAGASVTAQIKSLENQLSSASGDKAARISAEIWALERKARSA